MIAPPRSRTHSRSGFTLLELSISAAVLLVLSIGITQSVRSLSRLASHGGVDGRLQDEAQRALAAIQVDLRRAGFATIDGRAYPHLFVDGNAAAAFDAHDHAPAVENAQDGEPGFGPDREIVLRLPLFERVVQDEDGVNWGVDDPAAPTTGIVKTYDVPALDADGALIWSDADVAYVLVTGADGVNVLERRESGGRTSTVARNVERVTFESAAEAPAEVPLGAVRARLWMRDVDERGGVHRYFVEAVADLRNGGV